jgi:Fe-S-cluster containining protein
VLFDLVKLQPEDNAKALTARGLKIKKRQFFTQPCSALHGLQCVMYEHRPTRCRLFECGQFQQVAQGKLSESEAKARIEDVKQRVLKIESLLGASDNDNQRKALAQRYANVMADVVDENGELRDEMEQLQSLLNEHFRAVCRLLPFE